MSSVVFSWVVDHVHNAAAAMGAFFGSFGAFLVLGALFCVLSRPKGESSSLKGVLTAVVPPTAYRHRSSRIDYWNFALNHLFLYGTLFSLFIVSGEKVEALLQQTFGQPAVKLPKGWIAVTAQFIVIAVATDFGGFLQHYLLHRFQFLWRIHRCHHSAEVLTPFSTTRAHPIETLEQALVLPLFPGIATGVMLYFSGTQLSAVTVSMMAAFLFFRSFMENFRHSSMWISYGWRINHIFYCPAMHQIHHSSLARHHDKNMGDIFSVWDWLFGTLYVPKEREVFPFGVSDEEKRQNNPHRTIGGFYVEPVVTAFKSLFGSKGPAAAKGASNHEF